MDFYDICPNAKILPAQGGATVLCPANKCLFCDYLNIWKARRAHMLSFPLPKGQWLVLHIRTNTHSPEVNNIQGI